MPRWVKLVGLRRSLSSLTHVGGDGKASMVDVGGKVPTRRHAVAAARVLVGPEVFKLVADAEEGITSAEVLLGSKCGLLRVLLQSWFRSPDLSLDAIGLTGYILLLFLLFAFCLDRLCFLFMPGIADEAMRKGSVFSTAQLAGIMGAKRTSDLIPLCHPVPLVHVGVDLSLSEGDHSINVHATATTGSAQTGVEMEALTAASVAALTVYDMCKAASKAIRITDIRLLRKEGGKSGVYDAESGTG